MDSIRKACADCFNNLQNKNNSSVHNYVPSTTTTTTSLQKETTIPAKYLTTTNYTQATDYNTVQSNAEQSFSRTSDDNDGTENNEDDDFDDKFLLLVNDLGLDEHARAVVLDFNRDKKLQMYRQHRKSIDQPTNYVDKIKYFCQPQCEISLRTQTEILERLRALLRTERISSVEQFFNCNGLDMLIQYFQLTTVKYSDDRINEVVIGCLKNIMNCQEGRKAVLMHPKAVNVLTLKSLSYHNRNVRSRTLCISILSALCMVPGGHKKVIHAMTYAQALVKERTRFQTLLYDLDVESNYSDDYKSSIELKTAIIAFTNSLINYGPGEKHLEFRLHLRYEFMMLGIESIFDKLRIHGNAVLNKHIDFFELVRNKDEKEYIVKSSSKTKFDSKSVSSMIEALKQKYIVSPIYTNIMSILYHFLLIPQQSPSSSQQWRLIDNIVQEISIQSKDGDGDAEAGILGDNVKSIISKMIQEGSVKDTQKRLMDAEKKNMDMKTQLEKKEQECIVKSEEKEMLLETLNQLKIKLEKDALEYKKNISDMTLQIQQLKSNSLTNVHGNNTHINNDPDSNNLSVVHPISPNNSYVNNLDESNSFPPPPPPPDCCVPPPPPPPPPPLLIIGAVKPTKNCPQPNQPMKCFNWTKIPEGKIAGTIWEKLDDAKIYPQLDLNELERNFTAYHKQDQNFEGENKGLTNKSNKILSLIDGRRSQNCTIMLSKLKMSNWDLIQAIKNVDPNNELTKDMCEQLLKFIPTSEEIQMLNEHVKEIDNMAKADRFLLEISQVDHYEALLKCLYYKKKYNERINDIGPRVTAVSAACQEITDSPSLKTILEIILALGNFVNKGQRGNAYGFKLSSLAKMMDTRSSISKKTTLLHYLVEIVESKFPGAIDLRDEIPNVKNASKVALPDLETEINSLKTGLRDVENETKYQLEKRLIGQSTFCQIMNEFLNVSSCRLFTLADQLQDMKHKYQMVLKIFGEEANIQPEEFFKHFDQFLENMYEARNDNSAIKRMKEEEEKRLLREAEMRAEKSKRKASLTDGVQTETGEFDIMIKTLMTGEAYDGVKSKMKRNQVRKLSNLENSGSNISSYSTPKLLSPQHRQKHYNYSFSTGNLLANVESLDDSAINTPPKTYEGRRKASSNTTSTGWGLPGICESRERVLAIT